MGLSRRDDRRLFETLCLADFQSGLGWRTILAKRENLRAVFHGFDVEGIARFGARDVECLLKDAGIVRHRGKIELVINTARRTLALGSLLSAEGCVVRAKAERARRAFKVPAG